MSRCRSRPCPAGIAWALRPRSAKAHGGSSHARGKRPPTVEINSFGSYPNVRSYIHTLNDETIQIFTLEKLLECSTSADCATNLFGGTSNRRYRIWRFSLPRVNGG